MIKFYLIKKERKIISLSYKERDEGSNYFIGNDNSKYEVCSKMYDSLEGNETIDAIIKNHDMLEVLAIIKDNEKKV